MPAVGFCLISNLEADVVGFCKGSKAEAALEDGEIIDLTVTETVKVDREYCISRVKTYRV